MKKRLFVAMTLLLTLVAGARADGVHYTYDKGPDQHVIYVALTDDSGTALNDVHGLNDGTYYLGAFIGDECRGEATVQFYDEQQRPMSNGNLFTLIVEGDGDKDNGKTVTFRIYKEAMTTEGTAEYRIPATTSSVAFAKDGTTGTPSSPVKVKFVPATGITMASATVHIGGTLDLVKQMTTSPEDALIPYPLNWGEPSDNYEISADNILTAKGISMGEEISLTAGTGNFSIATSMIITIDNPAVAFAWTDARVTKDQSDASKGTITLPVGDAITLSRVLGGGYTLTGISANDPCSTTYTWTSNNPAVVGIDPAAGFTVNATGTATLTGTPDDGSTETSPRLTVTVVQPVTDFTFGTDERGDTVIVVQVGDNVTERINAMVNVVPVNATNKAYTIGYPETNFEIQDGKIIAKTADSDGTYPVNVNLSLNITADDGNGAAKTIGVVVIPAQPTAIAAIAPTVYEFTPETPPTDITDKLYANLRLQPEGMNTADYASAIFMASDNREVVRATGEDGNGRTTYGIYGKGTVTMQVTLNVLDNLNIETEVNATNGQTVATIYTKELTTQFNVEVHDGLSEFTFANVRTTAGQTVALTLTPQPDGVDFEADKIAVTVTPSVAMPDGWTFAQVSGAGLNWTIDAKSVGNGTITVSYTKDNEQKVMGRGLINVDQQLTLANDWQWISIYQGKVADKEAMKALLGNNMGEIRADQSLVFNDAEFGYFGTLSELDTLKTYKVRMTGLNGATAYTIAENNDPSTYFVNNRSNDETGAPASPLSIKTEQGWNWIGNPYQYYQKLTDVFGNTRFSEDDKIKSKTSFATYTNGQWVGELTYLTPGEGYMFYVAEAGQIDFTREFALTQQTAAPAAARTTGAPSPWTIDHSRFADNMSMIAHVGGLDNASGLTLYAFAGGECRGRGVAVGDRQFITIHGERGERFTFCVYDERTQQFYEIRGSRAFAPMSGTMAAPTPLYVGEPTSVKAIGNGMAAGEQIYDLQGRRVGSAKKGVYVQHGKKIIK